MKASLEHLQGIANNVTEYMLGAECAEAICGRPREIKLAHAHLLARLVNHSEKAQPCIEDAKASLQGMSERPFPYIAEGPIKGAIPKQSCHRQSIYDKTRELRSVNSRLAIGCSFFRAL